MACELVTTMITRCRRSNTWANQTCSLIACLVICQSVALFVACLATRPVLSSFDFDFVSIRVFTLWSQLKGDCKLHWKCKTREAMSNITFWKANTKGIPNEIYVRLNNKLKRLTAGVYKFCFKLRHIFSMTVTLGDSSEDLGIFVGITVYHDSFVVFWKWRTQYSPIFAEYYKRLVYISNKNTTNNICGVFQYIYT